MNGKKYLEQMKSRQLLFRRELRIKFIEKCKIYKEQKTFTNSGFGFYLGIQIIGKKLFGLEIYID